MGNIMTDPTDTPVCCSKCGKTGVQGPGWLSIARNRRIVESYCPDCTRPHWDEQARRQRARRVARETRA